MFQKFKEFLKTDYAYYPFVVAILIVVLVIPVVQYYLSEMESEEWENMTCHQMKEYQASAAHNNLSLEDQLEFHELYNPCLLNSEH